MNIDFARPFAFAFEDQDWMKKILIGALYILASLACYVGFFAMLGYQKRIIVAVADGRDVPLPEFDRFGEDLMEGLKIFVIMAVYMLPGIVLMMCGGLGGPAIADGAGEELGMLVMFGTICLAMPLLLLAAFMVPIGIIRYADTNQMGAAFQIGEVLKMTKENIINILLAIVIGAVANFIAQFTILLCGIGILAGSAWYQMVKGHAYGQILRIHRTKHGRIAA